jgi:hypothetical protein
VLNILNLSRVGATVDDISLANVTPGLHLVGAWVAHRGSPCFYANAMDIVGRHASVSDISACAQPIDGFGVPAHTDATRSERVTLILRVDKPGNYSFRGIVVHYHVGPIPYQSTYQLGMSVCAPRGVACHYRQY